MSDFEILKLCDMVEECLCIGMNTSWISSCWVIHLVWEAMLPCVGALTSGKQ